MSIAAHYWIGDRGVATGCNVPPPPVTFIPAAEYLARMRTDTDPEVAP